ncbi:protein G12-like [Topomyia yanbarensis]|uniref:protein G12-like n=1 Tax=Topomyia yanbarensis TaxID=2498891 RepID=UPI00273A9CF8|nr:protein G12-like [Topomyia yanbarensis]
MRQVLVVLLLISTLHSVAPTSVRDELIDLQNHVPMDLISRLFIEYLVQDAEFRRTIHYVRSREFSATWNDFLLTPKAQKLLSFLLDAELPVDEVLNLFADFVGAERPRKPLSKRFIKLRRGGVNSFIDAVIEAVTSSEVKPINEQKENTNPLYKEMTEKVNSMEYQQLLAETFEDPEVMAIQDELRVFDIEIPRLLDLMKAFFGWSAFF